MQSFRGISFTWALVLMGVLALFFVLRAFFAWQAVRRDAAADYDYKQANKMVPKSLTRDEYEAIYRRVYAPRGPLHVAGAMLGILIATPIAMTGMAYGLNLMYNLSGQSRVIEPGFLVWQFFLFFGIIAVWGGIAYIAARRYHRTAPGALQYEIDRHLSGDDDLSDHRFYDDEDDSLVHRLRFGLVASLFLAIALFVWRL